MHNPYCDKPFFYVPMPLNAEGQGPEMDDAKVVRIQHEVWSASMLSLGIFASEEVAVFVAKSLNAAPTV